MLPQKTDPRWKALIVSSEPLKLKVLAAKMVMTRARLMGARKDAKAIQEAIDTAYDYFAKNREAAADDLDALFGRNGEKS